MPTGVGSVNYASPEQIHGEPLTPASDIYALTGVLYQCLTGHVPYPRETEAGVMHAHLTQPPPSVSGKNAGSSAIDAVIARGMAKDPAERCACGRDLMADAADALRRLDRQSIAHAPPAVDSAAGAAATATAAINRAAGAAGRQSRHTVEPTAQPAIEPTVEPTIEPAEPTLVPPVSRRQIALACAGVGLAVLVVGIALVTGFGGRASAGAKNHPSDASHAGAQVSSAALGSHRAATADRPQQGRHRGTRATSRTASSKSTAKSSTSEDAASSSATTSPPASGSSQASVSSVTPASSPAASSPGTSAPQTAPAAAPTSGSGSGSATGSGAGAGSGGGSPSSSEHAASQQSPSKRYGPTVVAAPVE